MKITNKLNLPDMLVRAVEKEYVYRDKRYSITSLLDTDRVIMLKRRYNDLIEQDISDCIWMLFGTFTHFALENIPLKDGEYVEEHLEHTFDNGYTLSGIIDHIDNEYCDDYKTTSAWTVIYGSNNEKWKKQLQMGAYLHYKKHGTWRNKGRIIAILKDWNKKELLTNDKYPKLPVEVIYFDLGTPEEVEKMILKRFDEIIELEKLSDMNLPMCSMEERFNTGDKYIVIKKGGKRATKIHENKKDAEKHLENLEKSYPGIYEIQLREGEDKKCLNYCNCCKFCPYYLIKYDKDIKDISKELAEDTREKINDLMD